MSVTLLGSLLLAVSLVSMVVYMGALGQLLAGPRHPGLLRTAVCRLGAELLYVGVGLTVLVTNRNGPLIGLGVFTLVRFIWQANAIADVRLTRRERRANMPNQPPEQLGVSEPVPNYALPLSAAVVSAEIDRLSTKVNTLNKQLGDTRRAVADERRYRRTGWAVLGFTFLLAACGLVFGLVVFNRADRAEALSQQNAQIIAQLRSTQARLDISSRESCVLYGLLISTYSTRARAASPLGPEAYDSGFRRLVASAERQQCHLPTPPGLPS